MAIVDLVRFGIHAVQSLIALVIIGCSTARLSEHTSSYALAVFTRLIVPNISDTYKGVATILAALYIVTTSMVARYAYKFWVAITSNAITSIFWIATIGTLAAHHSGGCGGYKHDYCYRKRYVKEADSLWAATIALSVIDA
ncbi:hypothetical protein N7490_011669 [Penicillium lividum]|nr:hypothetical protein N7490_011669 [Penicillium lividum]